MLEVKDRPPARPRAEGTKGAAPPAATEPAPTTMRPLHPFEMMRRLVEDMDRMFEEPMTGFRRAWPGWLGRGQELVRRELGRRPGEWTPRVETFEREGHFVIRAELPGVAKENIRIEVAEDLLTLRGERKEETKREEGGYYYTERSYGSFVRTLPLPEGADLAHAKAEFREGVLEVELPLPKPQSKTEVPRVIEITGTK